MPELRTDRAGTSDVGAPREADSGRRRIWITAGKAVLGIGLLAAVLAQLDWSRVFEILVAPSWGWLALGVSLQAVAKLLWAARWQELLGAFGLERRFRDLLAFVLIGQFFNSFLPTSVGGDLVRGSYVTSEDGTEERGLLTSYGIVLVERLLGLGVLATMAAGGSAFLLTDGSSALPSGWTLGVLAVSAATAAVIGGVFAWDGTTRLATRLTDRVSRFGEELERLSRGLGVFHRTEVGTGRILLHTAAIQVTAIAFYVACAHAVGLEASPWIFLVAVPVSVVATMIPVTLNGLGVREGVLVGFLVAYGADAASAGALVLLALVVSVSFSVVGGVLFPFYRVRWREVQGVGPPT